MYVGTENGKFFILRPGPTGVETLDEDLLGTPDNPEPVLGSPAVANGRVYIGDATFVPGARPDVESLYGNNWPFTYRAGWGYLLLTTSWAVAPRLCGNSRRGHSRNSCARLP